MGSSYLSYGPPRLWAGSSSSSSHVRFVHSLRLKGLECDAHAVGVCGGTCQEDSNGNGLVDAGERNPNDPSDDVPGEGDSDGDGLTDVEEAAAGLPTPASRLCLACVVLQRFEYARVEYGTPVGGQAVEALMMALQQAALDSKHGVGVTAEDRLQDLIIRAAPPKRMTLFLAGQVSPEALAPGDGSPLADSLVDQVEVYPRCRVGRQADAETVPWPSLGEAMEGAWGVCLRLRFAGEENDEAWRRAERHASSKVLPPPFELRAHRGDGGWLEVACGLAEPPMHMALRRLYFTFLVTGEV